MTIETPKPTSAQLQSAIDHFEGVMTPSEFNYKGIRRERAVATLKDKQEVLKSRLMSAAAVGVTAVALAATAYELSRSDGAPDPTQAPIAQEYQKILVEGTAARNSGMDAQGNIQVTQP